MQLSKLGYYRIEKLTFKLVSTNRRIYRKNMPRSKKVVWVLMYSSIVKEFADTSIHNIWGRNMKISLSPTKLTGVNQ